MRNPQEALKNEWQSFGKLAKLVSSFKGCRDDGDFKLQLIQLYSMHPYPKIKYWISKGIQKNKHENPRSSLARCMGIQGEASIAPSEKTCEFCSVSLSVEQPRQSEKYFHYTTVSTQQPPQLLP